ncbi:MAG: radical SAM protein [Deltaproteobacteria bacterium]|nr:radical SAM protein [Deltaproteobacteria bacterium]
MRCRFCFETFRDVLAEYRGRVPLGRADLVALAEQIGPRFRKVSLAGGEPLLCPDLAEILATLKKHGTKTTSLVTNGSLLIIRPELLDELSGCLDWIGLSVDSAVPATLAKLGRAVRGQPILPSEYVKLAERIRSYGIRLKVNTVVTTLNCMEDMTPFVQAMKPDGRWKVFQVLPIQGQNDGKVENLLVAPESFSAFVDRHRPAFGATLVAETNDMMKGSYAMIDPVGRFFDDTRGRHHYSEPIPQVGIDTAFSQVRFIRERFDKRGGEYPWE